MPDDKVNKTKEKLKKIGGGLIERFLGQERRQLLGRGKSGVDDIINNGSGLVGEFVKMLMGNEKNIKTFENAIKCFATLEPMDLRSPFYQYVYQNGRFKLNQVSNYTVRYSLSRYLLQKVDAQFLILEKLKSDKLADNLEGFIVLVANRYSHVASCLTKEKQKTSDSGDTSTAERKIDEELSRQWKHNKSSEEGSRKSLAEIAEEANYAHKELQDEGVLFEHDNSVGTATGKALSGNFVKMFIRYLQRSFPNLKDCVKICYHEEKVNYDDEAENQKYSFQNKGYWAEISKLTKESSTNGMIYFVVNLQVVIEDGKVSYEEHGHGNVTVIYNGKYKVFDSFPQCAGGAIGETRGVKIVRRKIQNDQQNCVTIALGYMESLMKEISKNKEKWKSDEKMSFSAHVAKAVNKYFNLKVSDSIKELPACESTEEYREPKIDGLLPPKFIKYLQSSSGIEKIIRYARSLPAGDKEQKRWKKVADELEKVRSKYSLIDQPAMSFAYESEIKHTGRPAYRIGENLKNFIMKLISNGIVNTSVTVRQLLEFLRPRELSQDMLGEVVDPSFDMRNIRVLHDEQPLIDFIRKDKHEWVLNELKTKPVYKGVNAEPEKLTYNELGLLDAFEKRLTTIASINDRAQMKRRTETLKVATLVDILKRNGLNLEEEMEKVEKI